MILTVRTGLSTRDFFINLFYIIHPTGKYIRLHKYYRVFGERVLRLNNLFLLDIKILTLFNSSMTQILDVN